MNRSLIFFVVLALVVSITAADASLRPLRKEGRHMVGSRPAAEVLGRSIVDCLMGTGPAVFMAGITVDEYADALRADSSREAGAMLKRRPWRIAVVERTIPADEVQMCGVDATGNINWGASRDVPEGSWVLTDAPEYPQGGEIVISIDLSCFNVYRHAYQAKPAHREVTPHHHPYQQNRRGWSMMPCRHNVCRERYVPAGPMLRRPPAQGPYVQRGFNPIPLFQAFMRPPRPRVNVNQGGGQVFAPVTNVTIRGGTATGRFVPFAQPPPPSGGSGFRGFTGNGGSGNRGFTGGSTGGQGIRGTTGNGGQGQRGFTR